MKRILTIGLVAISLLACSQKSPRDKALSEIQRLEQSDSAMMEGYIQRITPMYLDFATQFPKDTASADFLYKASVNMVALNRNEEAMATIDKYMVAYPEHHAIPDALFYKGYLYQEKLNNLGKAKETYELFLQKYPNHAYSDDVKVSLENLTATPEELFQKIVLDKKDSTTAAKQ